MATYGVQPAMRSVNLGGYQAPQPIGGGLPFPSQQAAANIPFGGNPTQIANSYASAYNSALALNQANYQNVLKGYQQTLEGQAQRQHNTQTQFYELGDAIQGKIAGIGNEERQRIQDRYATQAARQSQGLIDRGLGNTTVQNSIMKGLSYDEARAQSALAEQVAGLQAGYMRDVGLQRIGQHAQGSREYVDLSKGQLDFMNSVNSPYPDAGLYASLAAQAAAEEQLRRGAGGGGQAMTAMGGGGVSYGPADPTFGRPSPGLFGGPSMQSYQGYGYVPQSYAPSGPTGYLGAAGGSKLATDYSGATPQVGFNESALAAVAGYPALAGGSARDAFTPQAGVNYAKQEAIY